MVADVDAVAALCGGACLGGALIVVVVCWGATTWNAESRCVSGGVAVVAIGFIGDDVLDGGTTVPFEGKIGESQEIDRNTTFF